MLSGSYSASALSGYGTSSASLSTFFGNVASAEQTLNSGLTGGADTLFSMEGSRSMLNSGPAATLMGFGRFGSSAAYTGGMGAGMGGSGIGMGANFMVGGPPPGVVGAGIYQGPLVFGNPTPQPTQVFGPNAFANLQGGGAAPAGGGTSVTASNRGSKADRITNEMREKATDSVMEMGYSAEDAKRIVDMAEKASGGDQRSFREILGKLPPHQFEEKKDDKGQVQGPTLEQQKAKWVRAFGDWQARYIEDVDRRKDASEARQQLVADAGSQGGASYEFKRKPDTKSKGYGYEVVKAEGNDRAVNATARVYFNPQDKQWYKDPAMTQKLSLPGAADASSKPDTITVGGGSDAMGLTPAGTHAMEAKAGTEVYQKVYDRYEVTEKDLSGPKAHETFAAIPVADGEKRYVYYGRASNTWAYLQADGRTFTTSPNARLVDGRLYFSAADSVNPATADDVDGYMTRMHDTSAAAATRRDDMAKGAEAQRTQRVDQVMKQLREPIAEANRGDITHAYTYDAQKQEGVLAITVNGDDAARKAVHDGLGGDGTAKDARGDAILGQLPEGTRISVNGGTSFPVGAAAYKQVRDGVKAAGPKDAKISDAVDMKSMTESDQAAQDAVYKRLHGMVEKQRGDGTLKSVELSGPITLDSSKVSVDAWGKVTARLRDAYPNVAITFTGPVKGSDGMDYASINNARNQTVSVDTRTPAAQTTTETTVNHSVQQPVTPATTGAQNPQLALNAMDQKARVAGYAATSYRSALMMKPRASEQEIAAKREAYVQALKEYEASIATARQQASNLPDNSPNRGAFMRAWESHQKHHRNMSAFVSNSDGDFEIPAAPAAVTLA